MSIHEEKNLIDDVAAIKRAVIGEEQTGQIGLVKRVWRLEKWQRNLDLRIATMSGIATALVLVLKYVFTKSL